MKKEFTAGADIFWGRAGQYNDNYNYSDIIFLYKTSLINIQFNIYVAKVNIKQRYSFELCHTDHIRSVQTAAQRRASWLEQMCLLTDYATTK